MSPLSRTRSHGWQHWHYCCCGWLHQASKLVMPCARSAKSAAQASMTSEVCPTQWRQICNSIALQQQWLQRPSSPKSLEPPVAMFGASRCKQARWWHVHAVSGKEDKTDTVVEPSKATGPSCCQSHLNLCTKCLGSFGGHHTGMPTRPSWSAGFGEVNIWQVGT